MIKQRTKQGNHPRPTTGVPGKTVTNRWILVADQSGLRLFERRTTNEKSSVHLMRELVEIDGRKKVSDLVSGRQGRNFDSHDSSRKGQTGGARHGYSSSTDPKETIERRLARKAMDIMLEEMSQETANEFLVVADARLTGILRVEAERKAVGNLKVTFCEKDYAWLKGAELEKRLLELIEPR